MRDLLVEIFNSNVQTWNVGSCAVVGGTKDEPEISGLVLQQASVKTFGIEDSDETLDLNIQEATLEQFDLVICSQVLEHVWNVRAALKNLAGLTSDDGLLWINVPASNFVHGSPEYFSAGYSQEFLLENLQDLGLEIVQSGQICSRRNYLARHKYALWLSEAETQNPFRYLRSGNFLESMARTKKHFLQLLNLAITKDKDNEHWAVETWVLVTPARDKQNFHNAKS